MNGGDWEIEVHVVEGTNAFEIIATDAAGDQSVSDVIIDWSGSMPLSAN